MTAWIVVLLVGAGTLALRSSFLVFLGDAPVPERLERGLRFVPAAVLTAIVVPEVLRPDGAVDVTLGNPRLLAALVALLVAWRTRNIGLTILAGLVAQWLVQAVLA